MKNEKEEERVLRDGVCACERVVVGRGGSWD